MEKTFFPAINGFIAPSFFIFAPIISVPATPKPIARSAPVFTINLSRTAVSNV
jgi:hypothetical protein